MCRKGVGLSSGPRPMTPGAAPTSTHRPPQATAFAPALTPTQKRAGRASEASLFSDSLCLHRGRHQRPGAPAARLGSLS